MLEARRPRRRVPGISRITLVFEACTQAGIDLWGEVGWPGASRRRDLTPVVDCDGTERQDDDGWHGSRAHRVKARGSRQYWYPDHARD